MAATVGFWYDSYGEPMRPLYIINDHDDKIAHVDMDMVNHPKHYTEHPSGIECIDIVRNMPFSLGAAVKYAWRAGYKDDLSQDLNKCIWYINDCINHDISYQLTTAEKTGVETWIQHESNTYRLNIVSGLTLLKNGYGYARSNCQNWLNSIQQIYINVI